jgi:glycosyltransferase involved in cell wall biosynthesis
MNAGSSKEVPAESFESNTSPQRGYQQTLLDRIISGANTLQYAVTESTKLRIARATQEANYARQDRPLVSVVIPTFNRAKILLERGVPTVLSQTYENLELIIVGNSCTDDTGERLSRVRDTRLSYFNLPVRRPRFPDDATTRWVTAGLEPTREAFRRARGQWLAWLGDDDIWTPDHIEKLLRFAQEGRHEFVSAHYEEERFGERKIIPGERAGGPYYTRRAAHPNDASPLIGGMMTCLYRSYLRLFPININSWRKGWNRPWDVDLYLRMYYAGVRFGYLDEVVAFVLPRPGEKTIGLDSYKLIEQQKIEMHKQ